MGNQYRATPLVTWPHGSREWLEQRFDYIGGSEVAAIMGLSPFKSYYSLWWEKHNRIVDGSTSDAMVAGNRFEAGLRAEFFARHLELEAMPVRTYTSREFPWALASVDGIARDRASGERLVVEFKTSISSPFAADLWRDGIPPHYMCQVQWYMGILGLNEARLFAFVTGKGFIEERTVFDGAFFDLMIAAATEFRASLAEGRSPDPDGTDSTYRTIRAVHPDIEAGATVEIDGTVCANYLEAVEGIEFFEAAKKEAVNQILHTIGSAEFAVFDGVPIAKRAARAGGKPFLTKARKSIERMK